MSTRYAYGRATPMSTRPVIVTCHWSNGHVNAKSFSDMHQLRQYLHGLEGYVISGILIKAVVS